MVTELISRHASRTPEALAVSCGSASLTYAELEAAALGLAEELVRRGNAPHQRVGVLIDRSVDLVIALLATLKAGNAFVPLDPDYPADRLRFIATQSDLGAVLSRSTLNDRLTGIDIPFLCIDRPSVPSETSEAARLTSRITVDAEDTAYIVYTSGSTGQPKGVCVPHRALSNTLSALSAIDAFDVKPDDVHVAVATISFDIATLEILLPLVNGAHLVVATENEVSDSRELHRLLQRHRATFLQGTPITWELLLEAGWVGNPPLNMLCGGEAMSRRLADRLLALGNRLWNGYGPTETAIVSSAGRVTDDAGPVLIGPAIANTQFYVLNERGRPVAAGEAGELYIGGEGVASGYFRRPDLTSERFVPDSFCGLPGARMYRTGDIVRVCANDHYQFLGRIDEQIKIRGFRVELGEIEAALLGQPHVKDAAVVVRGDEDSSRTIIAFVVAAAPFAAANAYAWESDLRLQLKAILPTHMVPSSIVTLDSLPRTPNGKLDKRALARYDVATLRAPDESSTIAAEERLRNQIARLLERRSVGLDEDFFALGFNSMHALALVKMLQDALGYRVPLAAIYDNPTASGLAKWLAATRPAGFSKDAGLAVSFLNAKGTRPPLLYFHNDLIADGVYCRQLAAAVGEDQPIVAIAPHGTAGLQLEYSIEAMARDYVVQIRKLGFKGPYRLGGLCASGLVAYEVARQLRDAGDRVERLVLINAWPISTRANTAARRTIRAIAMSPHLPLSIRQQFCYDVERLFELLGNGPSGVGRFAFERLSSAFRRVSRTLRQLRATNAAPPIPSLEMESVVAHIVAPLTYQPQPYDGPLTLFWSDEEETSLSDVRNKWLELVNEIKIISVRGNHLTPIQAGVTELGHALNEMLL